MIISQTIFLWLPLMLSWIFLICTNIILHKCHNGQITFVLKRLQKLQKFVLDCLAEAEKLKCLSIAFPAIGTGNLAYPKQEVAQAMFEAVQQFEDRQHFLKEVKFVLYHQDKESIQVNYYYSNKDNL